MIVTKENGTVYTNGLTIEVINWHKEVGYIIADVKRPLTKNEDGEYIDDITLHVKDKDLIKERETELNRALALGNLEHTKIKIYFEDDQSRKLVETTVWGVTDKRVILKQGVVIPINRVHKISL